MEMYLIEKSLTLEDMSLFKQIEKFWSDLVTSALFGGYPFFSIEGNSKICRGLIVSKRGISILTRDKDEFDSNRMYLTSLFMKNIEFSKILFNNSDLIHNVEMSNRNAEEIIDIINSRQLILKEEEIRSILSLIQNNNLMVKKDERIIINNNSLGAKIVDRSKRVAVLDEDQFSTVYSEYHNNMRIRGLAGSGKTILLAKKMAYIHFKERQKELAYIFYTKSLKQTVDTFFKTFYEEMACNGETPDMSKIHIMYAWGGYESPGLVSTVAKKIDIKNPQFSRSVDFESVCKEMIKNVKDLNMEENVKIYDYIFIDEAQDFRLNFFELVRMTLKTFGKLTYAYDELQTLIEQKSIMPTKEEILQGEECIDKNLKTCYRTPNEILITAHALGLGIYHFNNGKREFINVIQDRTIWEATGYVIKSGELLGGHDVVLKRNNNLIPTYDIESIVTKKIDEKDIFAKVIDEIISLINNESVLPEDILIIDLDSNFNNNYCGFMDELQKRKLGGSRPFEVNLINKDQSFIFKRQGYVSYTTIFRAKGNEANIVFILNSSKDSTLIGLNRNKLFTAMTRAKFQVYLYGNGKMFDDILSEIKAVKDNNYELSFTYPTDAELVQYKNKIYQETQTQSKFDEIDKDKNVDKLAIMKMLFEKMTPEEKKSILESLKE